MIKIEPSEHLRGGELRFGYYMPQDGDKVHRLVMWVESGGQREYVATVNFDGEPPPRGFVYLKSWSGNEGVPEALVRSGVVKLLDEWLETGYVRAQKAQLTEAALAELERQRPKRPPLQ